MSQAISIVNKPKVCSDVIWRWDGEDNQIIVLSKESFALPLMLNITAAKIFSLCNGRNSVEDIAKSLCEEFALDDYKSVLKDVQGQINYFVEKEIVQI